MSVEQQVDTLADAVDALLGSVNSKTGTLDAAVADGVSATAQAQAAKASALSARDQAGAFKDAAYAAAQSAASAVAYQDLTALAQTKAVNAADVFIYDTSKDSDGGAWRHRCAATSWFNEPLNTPTRGARREFPAVAVILAEENRVTIYDGDDPSLPMWRILLRDTVSTDLVKAWWRSSSVIKAQSVAALNGKICVGLGGVTSANCGLAVADFLADDLQHYSSASNISNRGLPITATGSDIALPINLGAHIVGYIINDVAMTVLSDAPVDPATGLPVPTIAVATQAGTSILRHDGTIVSGGEANVSWSIRWVEFAADHVLWGNSGSLYGTVMQILSEPPYNTVTSIGAGNGGYQQIGQVSQVYGQNTSWPFGLGQSRSIKALPDSILVSAASRGVTRILDVPSDRSSAMVAYAASNYATGWMPGEIKGAWLADTNDTDLVSTELVANGTFDVDTSGWALSGEGSLSVVSGAMRVLNNDPFEAGASPGASYPVATVPGAAYILSVDIVGVHVGSGGIGVSNIAGSTNRELGQKPSAGVGHHTLSFIATSTLTYIKLFSWSTAASAWADFDNVSVRPADADRSVNAKGLIVNGTVTRGPVAQGAELVAYSGFSPSNYLELPDAAALNFGVGDFCVMGWARRTLATYIGLFGRVEGTATSYGTNWMWGYWGDQLSISTGFGGGAPINLVSNTALPVGVWGNWAIVRRSGIGFLYISGSLVGSGPLSTNISIDSGFRVGLYYFNDWTGGGENNSALLRISATAPTAEQIRRIYEDEKLLFQENAECTLYGTSNAVTALAHDPDTGLLHVGTNQGRSMFKGLRRVAHTTEPVTAAISANRGMIVQR